MIAVVPVRDGVVPLGGDETVSECGGRALLIGSGTAEAASSLHGVASGITCAETLEFRPAAWAAGLSAHLVDEPIVVLPASPDGRDLAPRLAAALARMLYAQAVGVSATAIQLTRAGGTAIHHLRPPACFVATLSPGVRGVDRIDVDSTIEVHVIDIDVASPPASDPAVVAVLAADASTIDLAEAPRIIGGGAGLDGAGRFDQLSQLAALLGASVGATRVITDRGWIGHDRQIGTTGVVVDPRLYLAFGISGAVQHTSGLGQPDHIISVNTDPHCPMMQLADLAVVGDANEILDALLIRLSQRQAATAS